MMIGHLTFARIAEFVIRGGVVAYLQKAEPSLLKRTAPGALTSEEAVNEVQLKVGWRTTRPLWLGLALLMILSPLGLLASGMAWGASDFTNPAIREQIAKASGHLAPPAHAPQGIEHLSSIWTAPIPDYAPAFMQSETFVTLCRPRLGLD